MAVLISFATNSGVCACLFVPEGRLRIAQRFIAGTGRSDCLASPGGTIEIVCARATSIVPPGLIDLFAIPNPAINRWAILKCPSGAKARFCTIQTLQLRFSFSRTNDRLSIQACQEAWRGFFCCSVTASTDTGSVGSPQANCCTTTPLACPCGVTFKLMNRLPAGVAWSRTTWIGHSASGVS